MGRGTDGRTVLSLVVPTVLAVALRIWASFDRPFDHDEIAFLWGDRPWTVVWDEESGVNPPWVRLVVASLAGPAMQPWVGRALSVLMAAVQVPAVFALTRALAGGRLVPAVLAALVVAVHPTSVWMGGSFRNYAVWAAALAVWLWAWDRVLREGKGRAVAVAAGVVMGACHYLAYPLLLGGALVLAASRRWRDAAWCALPPLVWLPFAVPMLGAAPRMPAAQAWWQSAWVLWALDLRSDLSLRSTRELVGIDQAQQAFAAVAVAVLLGVAWARRRRLGEGGTFVLGAWAALWLGILVAGTVQQVRPPVAAVLVGLVVTVGFAALWGARWGRVGTALVVAALVLDLPGQLAQVRAAERASGPPAFVRELATWRERAAGGQVAVAPASAVVTLWWYQTGGHLRFAPRPEHCPQSSAACANLEGLPLVGWSGGEVPHALMLRFDTDRRPDPRCEAVDTSPGLWAWDCR